MSQEISDWSTATSLIEQIKQNDQEAWVRFARLYTPLVYHWSRRSGLDPQDAADTIQEVFQLVHSSVKRYHPGNFRGWLWRITHNQLMLRRRKGAVKIVAKGGSDAQALIEQIPESLPESGSSTEYPSDESEPQEADSILMNRILNSIQGDFTPQTWNLFWRLAVEQAPVQEVADAYNVSTSVARKAKFRVLTRIREELNQAQSGH